MLALVELQQDFTLAALSRWTPVVLAAAMSKSSSSVFVAVRTDVPKSAKRALTTLSCTRSQLKCFEASFVLRLIQLKLIKSK